MEYWLIKATEETPSWESGSLSPSQQSSNTMQPEDSLPRSQEPVTDPYSEPC